MLRDSASRAPRPLYQLGYICDQPYFLIVVWTWRHSPACLHHNTLGQYVSIGTEEPETPHQFPPQPTNPPTAPTPIETNTFVHILDSPALSPSPFQYLPQEVSTMEIHPTEE